MNFHKIQFTIVRKSVNLYHIASIFTKRRGISPPELRGMDLLYQARYVIMVLENQPNGAADSPAAVITDADFAKTNRRNLYYMEMDWRQRRTVTILTTVLLTLLAAVLIVLGIRYRENREDAPEGDEAVAASMTVEGYSALVYSNGSTTLSFIAEEEGDWAWENDPQLHPGAADQLAAPADPGRGGGPEHLRSGRARRLFNSHGGGRLCPGAVLRQDHH